MRVAVIGGGITGLAAAHALAGDGRVEVDVFEADTRLGGKILTTEVAGRPIDAGPDAFLARVPWATDLAVAVGLGDELVSPAVGSAYVYRRGHLRPIPAGLVLGVPTDLRALVRSGLLTPQGMARAALEPMVPRRAADHDSVGALVRSRFGDEVLESVVDPLLGGIYAGDADHMSLAATSPQLAMAADGRSLLAGLRKQAPAPPPTGGRPAPVFHSLAHGLGTLVEAVAAAITSSGRARIHTGAPAGELARSAGGWVVRDERFDAVICTAPAFAAADLVRDASADAARALSTIRHASVALLTIVVEESALSRPLDASGLLVPRPERRVVTACSWGSTKWPAWKVGGRAVLRASAGAMGDERALELDDDALTAAVLADLERLMGSVGTPVEVRVTRWPAAFPQYEPHHLGRIEAVQAALARDADGVIVTGAAHRGIGIPACIRQGTEAATTVLGRIGGAS